MLARVRIARICRAVTGETFGNPLSPQVAHRDLLMRLRIEKARVPHIVRRFEQCLGQRAGLFLLLRPKIAVERRM